MALGVPPGLRSRPGLPSPPGRGPRDGAGAGSLARPYLAIRRQTERLCEPLEVDDYLLQSMPEASPPKWHLAHVTWFFETFVLARLPGHRPHDRRFSVLFNSYYQSVGPQHPRPSRGLLSRPTVAEVYAYRRAVDDRMLGLLASDRLTAEPELATAITLGLQHEQQHQELLLTDLKHGFAANPLRPAYRPLPRRDHLPGAPARWLELEGGLVPVGHAGPGFAFDNESPRHEVHLRPFRLASRLVTNAEYAAFVADGGYRDWRWWLSDGWDIVRARGWSAPLYWERDGGGWLVGTLGGPAPLPPEAPVCHVSYYEADAYARWRRARLPAEAEWEHAVEGAGIAGNFVETGWLEPVPDAAGGAGVRQAFGDVWEWTRSAYAPYPGYRAPAGALGEYNGKFMVNQLVLRGGSCATPVSHIRRTYRNFFPPDARWQWSGIRLAEDA